MTYGRAILRLRYPEIEPWGWYHSNRTYTDYSRKYPDGDGKTCHWRKLINLCRTLKRTGVDYSVCYRFLCGSCFACVKWNTGR